MGVAVVVCVIGLAAVLAVLYRDAPPVAVTVVPAPVGEALPRPEDVVAPRFPTAALGYDRGVVDAHVRRLAAAYADLFAVAPNDVRARARARAEARTKGAQDRGGRP